MLPAEVDYFGNEHLIRIILLVLERVKGFNLEQTYTKLTREVYLEVIKVNGNA